MVKTFKNKTGQELLLKSYDKLLTQWGVKLTEKNIDTRYGTTHVILCGDPNNPPLALFHGVGDNSALMWIFNARELSKYFYLIAIDTIGGPTKSIPNSNYGKEFRQEIWIDDVLDSLGLEKIFLAGVSNGAYLAQLYTAKRPGRVNGAVCMAGSVEVGGSGFAMIKKFKVFFPEALFPTEKNVVKLLTKICGVNKDVFIKNNDLMEHWKYLLKYGVPMAMGFHKILPLSQPEIKILSDKALFIVGDRDPIVSANSKEIFEANGIRYIMLKGSGHGINHEFADTVNKYIIEFLTGIMV